MKRLAGMFAAVVAVAACLVMIGCAQAAGSAESAITVSASASAEVAPDKADIDILVSSQGATEQDVADAAARASGDITARLKTLGVPESAIQVSKGQPEPRYGDTTTVEEVATGYYDWFGNWIDTGVQQVAYETAGQVVGYDMATRVQVRGLDVAVLGSALRESAAAGASGFDGLAYHVSDREAAYQQALAAAVDAAHAKAEALADAGSVFVGRVVNMVEESGVPSDLSRTGDVSRLDVGNAATLEVQPAAIPVEASITVSYAIS